MPHLILLLIGFVIGTIGTLIGAGGGFILVPLLLFLWPQWSPEHISAISITVVFFNGLSGTIAYASSSIKRIDAKGGLFFSLFAIPGVLLGIALVPIVPKQVFCAVLAVVLLVSSLLMFLKAFSKETDQDREDQSFLHPEKIFSLKNARFKWIGAVSAFIVGVISSLLGIGGGIIHVPILIFLMGYPVLMATATSHFVLAVTSGLACGIHLFQGHLNGLYLETGLLSLGAMIGAQLGAYVSHSVPGRKIILIVAFALIIIALRLFLRGS